MKLVDTNVLLYAAIAGRSTMSPHAAGLSERSSGDPLILPWMHAIGFIRISTLPGSFPNR